MRPLIAVCALASIAALPVAPAYAACSLGEMADDADHRVLDCGDGVILHATRDAELSLASPSALTLQKGAVSVEFHPGARKAFEVRAPRAVAAVRGTKWVVETSEAKTSVFVLTGEVRVTETGLGRTRVLRPGQGLDISDSTDFNGPQVWPRARVDELLKRLGE